MSWLAGGLEHPENGNAGTRLDIRKVSMEKTSLGLQDSSLYHRVLQTIICHGYLEACNTRKVKVLE
jgi:hypothetical protein